MVELLVTAVRHCVVNDGRGQVPSEPDSSISNPTEQAIDIRQQWRLDTHRIDAKYPGVQVSALFQAVVLGTECVNPAFQLTRTAI